MKNSLDIHQTLKVFHLIVKHGIKVEDAHRLNGINAASDFDGYTVELWDENVRLSVFFHNKYSVDYQRAFELEAFYEKLLAIEKMKFDKID